MTDVAARAAAARAEIAARWPGCHTGEVRDGWIVLVRDALDEIDPDASFVVRLICENGQLRFVNRGGTPSPSSLTRIAAASQLASSTCEECARRGARRVGRDEVLCAKHAPPPGVEATAFQIRVADARDEIGRRWPRIDQDDCPDGWVALALHALDEIDALSYVEMVDGTRCRVESEADRVVRLDSDGAALTFSQGSIHAIQVQEALTVFDHAREASTDLCEICGEHGARRTGHDNRLCAAHAPDLRAWRRDLSAHAADTEETILAALDPDADQLEEWAPTFVATIPWERRRDNRALPRTVEAATPELVVERLVACSFLRGRYSASMTPREQDAALRRLWTPAVIRRVQARVNATYAADFDVQSLPAFARKALARRTQSLPAIPTWETEWPPLVLLESELDAWGEQYDMAWPGRHLTLMAGSASTFLRSLVRSRELNSCTPIAE